LSWVVGGVPEGGSKSKRLGLEEACMRWLYEGCRRRWRWRGRTECVSFEPVYISEPPLQQFWPHRRAATPPPLDPSHETLTRPNPPAFAPVRFGGLSSRGECKKARYRLDSMLHNIAQDKDSDARLGPIRQGLLNPGSPSASLPIASFCHQVTARPVRPISAFLGHLN
jgi:hypothetical protein